MSTSWVSFMQPDSGFSELLDQWDNRLLVDQKQGHVKQFMYPCHLIIEGINQSDDLFPGFSYFTCKLPDAKLSSSFCDILATFRSIISLLSPRVDELLIRRRNRAMHQVMDLFLIMVSTLDIYHVPQYTHNPCCWSVVPSSAYWNLLYSNKQDTSRRAMSGRAAR